MPVRTDTPPPSAAAPSCASPAPPAESEEPDGPDSLCIVCMAAPQSHAFVPCGHNCVCGDCSDAIMARTGECPYCRKTAIMAMRIYTT